MTNYDPANLTFQLAPTGSGTVLVQAVCQGTVWQWGEVEYEHGNAQEQIDRMRLKVSGHIHRGWERGMRLPWSDPTQHSWKEIA